jgi:hypothetical protein
MVGCTLDKPSFVNQRTLLGETSDMSTEDTSMEKPYDDCQAEYICRRATAGKDKCSEIVRPVESCLSQPWNEFRGEVLQVVMKPSGEGKWIGSVVLEGKQVEYNQAVFVVVAQDMIAVSDVCCPTGWKPVAKRDLSLQESLAKSTVAYEQREVKVGNEFRLEEGAAVKPISNIDEMFQIISALGDNEKALSEWSFITAWPSLSVKRQLEIYSAFISNELNLFLYFKDKEFTEMVIKPHLKNKNKKNIVDLFILEDLAALKEYFNPYCLSYSLSKLNFLEICLLMVSFQRQRTSGVQKFYPETKARSTTENRLPCEPGKAGFKQRHFEARLELVPPEVRQDDQHSTEEDHCQGIRSRRQGHQTVEQPQGRVCAANVGKRVELQCHGRHQRSR